MQLSLSGVIKNHSSRRCLRSNKTKENNLHTGNLWKTVQDKNIPNHLFLCYICGVFSCVLCTCSPLVDRFPIDTASVRKPSRTTPVSQHCSHDHTLILVNQTERGKRGKTESLICGQKMKYVVAEETETAGHRCSSFCNWSLTFLSNVVIEC